MNKISGNIIVLPDRLIRNASLLFDAGKITGLETGDSDSESFDNSIVLPGFIDLHTHGRLGQDMLDIDHELLLKYARTGTTSLLAGEGGVDLESLKKWLEQLEALMNDPVPGEAEVLGAHVEGPFIDPENAGGIQKGTYLVPTDETIRYFASSPVVKYMTVSPYVEGAIDAIRQLSEAGIICVSGHTRGNAELLKQAHTAGLRGICHFLNNNSHYSDVFKEPGVRKPTICESALLYDDMHLEIICDLQHVDPAFIEIALKVKGPSRIAAITDSILVAGLPDGIYSRVDGREVEVKDGGIHLVEDGGRCGSCVNQVEMFANLVDKIGVSLSDAARMCSLTPAQILGVDSRKGSLEQGKDADILVVDRDTFDIKAVFVKGHRV